MSIEHKLEHFDQKDNPTMANYKVILLASMVGLILIVTLWSSSFMEYGGGLNHTMFRVITSAFLLALYKLETISQLVGKIIGSFSKPNYSFSMPKGLQERRQKLSSLSKPPAPWNLAILIVLYIFVAICQDKVRTYFYLI